ncbi:MAG: peptidyl-prolyl cis-trans isomerase [Proteobacteria bacterium]|nr:peptidyl-prolyl cis-trans isomerase [Pseudomonadota bacterium]
MTNPPSPRSRYHALLHEPTLHFFGIAVLIFALYAIFQAGSENVLELDQREIDARIFMQEMTSGEPLSDQQREIITSLYVEEQILVQEAMAMGLDNDARIHDMLAQKMRHVLSGDIIQPSQEELATYYTANMARYRTLPTVSVDELVFDNPGQLPQAVVDLLSTGADPEQMLGLTEGSQSPLPNVNHIDLSNIFEPAFADTVFAASIGQWNGPFVSNRGQHWLRVSQRNETRLPPLNEISDRVRLDWISEEEEMRLQEEVDKLWDRYTIIITEAEQD